MVVGGELFGNGVEFVVGWWIVGGWFVVVE